MYLLTSKKRNYRYVKNSSSPKQSRAMESTRVSLSMTMKPYSLSFKVTIYCDENGYLFNAFNL